MKKSQKLKQVFLFISQQFTIFATKDSDIQIKIPSKAKLEVKFPKKSEIKPKSDKLKQKNDQKNTNRPKPEKTGKLSIENKIESQENQKELSEGIY